MRVPCQVQIQRAWEKLVPNDHSYLVIFRFRSTRFRFQEFELWTKSSFLVWTSKVNSTLNFYLERMLSWPWKKQDFLLEEPLWALFNSITVQKNRRVHYIVYFVWDLKPMYCYQWLDKIIITFINNKTTKFLETLQSCAELMFKPVASFTEFKVIYSGTHMYFDLRGGGEHERSYFFDIINLYCRSHKKNSIFRLRSLFPRES